MQLLETIRIVDGIPQHIEYHNIRFCKSQKVLFGLEKPIDLAVLLTPPNDGVYRCRVLYEKQIHLIEYLPYEPKKVEKIALVESALNYPYKYANREELEQLLRGVPLADDVLIYLDGEIKDTTIANVAFKKDTQWYTPKNPMLEGTTRQRLLDNGFLIAKSIKIDEIASFDGFALMNAMIGFREINPIWLDY